ncbi:MAG: UDP-N-acetylglucosamine--N-acetylmuramyl-(pentapeptide) pyrophosphoryl-undecaprenol N-acetylglucosamine transferase [Clostridiales bacterium]|nr:UDP-N-acetylglucosamine--N-acetylmuramyl-(pentapeptide) pyrophosphoryl-undecaprenol N-acetylglucosamine transferase [Clostridiales bacterium]
MKIVFSGGGTAGHVTPNLALIDKLSQEQIYYVGTNGMEKTLTVPYVADGRITEFCEIPADKLQRKLTLKNFALPIKLIKSIREAKKHLKRIQPDVIFSKGGYVGLPVVIAGKQLKIPTVIHESDMSLGLANKICALFSSDFLAAFPCDKRAKVVGLIIRQEIQHGVKKNGLATMGFDGSKPILLVTGGSLGAKALNDAVVSCPSLAERFDIFVITGKNKHVDCDFVRQAEFVTNMNDLLAAADVCLTRAGSNTLAELTLAEVPFVTVPLTKQSRGEQVKNAEWFTKRGCGLRLSEENLPEKLLGAVNAAYDNRVAIQTKQRAQKCLYGTDKTVEEILKYKK